MSCASYMQRRVCADAVQSFAPKAKRCSLSDSFSQQETCWPGGRRSARCSLDRRPVLQSDPRNCALVHRRNHAEARKSGRLRYGQTQLRAPSAAVTGAVSRIAEASVAKESRKGRLQSLQGLPEMRGLRLHLYKKQALKTPLGRCCNAVQGGDSQGNRGTTGRSETAGPEAASSREEEGEAEKLSEKEESATEKLLREMREVRWRVRLC